MDPEITVTLAYLETGQSESIPVPLTTTVKELMELAGALLAEVPANFSLAKDGKNLPPTMSLGDAGVVHGDLLAVRPVTVRRNPEPAAASGGLDFSALLGGGAGAASAPSSSNNTSGASRLRLPSANSSSSPPNPVYYPGMTLDEAMMYNPHPVAMVTVLLGNDVLFKQLNYHQPAMASKLRGKSIDEAAKVWREEMVKGGIRGAMAQTERFQKDKAMQLRLEKDPNDAEAKAYFAKEKHQKEIETQFREMMGEYPEAMGQVLMLYIEAKVNGVSIQPFVDSGAQSTIMSKECAEKVGIDHLIDTRFAGVAVGVGTGKILGRIHIVSLQIGTAYFPCTVTVMEKLGQEFLLGLDMLKRHTCQIDLVSGMLRFRLGGDSSMSTPFLHEKDLDATRGGTKGFDADKANKELEEQRKKGDNGDKGDGNETDDKVGKA